MLHALHIKQFPTVRLYQAGDSKHYKEFHQLDSGDDLNLNEFKSFLSKNGVEIPTEKKEELSQEDKELQEGANFDVNQGSGNSEIVGVLTNDE